VDAQTGDAGETINMTTNKTAMGGKLLCSGAAAPLITAIAMLCSHKASAQGQFSARNQFSPTDRRFVFQADGVTPAPTNTGRVEILYNDAVISPVSTGAGSPLTLPGIFVLGALTVPGVPAGRPAVLVVRVWDNSTGETFASATASGSEEVVVPSLGGGLAPPAPLSGFQGFSLGCGICGVTPTAPNQEIIFNPLPNITYSTNAIALNPTASSGLPVTLTVTGGPATLDGYNLTPTGIGVVVITATQPGNGTYHAAPSVTHSFAVHPISQTLSFTPPPSVVGTTNSIALTATSSSGLPVTFAVTSGPGVIQNGNLVFTGWGLVQVEALQPGTDVIAPATPVTHAVQALQPQSIDFPPQGPISYTTAATPLGALASSGLPVSYSVVDGPGAISGQNLLVSGVGDIVVQASQAGDSTHAAAAAVTQTITVTKAAQSIHFYPIADTTPTAGPTTLVAVATSLDRVFFNVASGPATIAGDILTVTGTGVVSVVATQPGDALYLPAPSVTNSFTVGLGSQSITFAPLPDLVATNTPVQLSASASSGLMVGFSLAGGPATLAGSTLTLTGAGTVTVVASQAGNAGFAAAIPVTNSFNVTKAPQTIFFPPIPDTTYSTTPVAVHPTASSGLGVSLAVPKGPGAANGYEVNLYGAGQITVVAFQQGNAIYQAAPAVTNVFNVAKAAQSISFASVADTTYTTNAIALSATSTSGLHPVFSVVSGPAVISGGNLFLTGAGAVRVAAMQSGNLGYLSATPVTNAFNVFSVIAGRRIFYNHSAWDGNDAAANTNDDLAIATDKQPLLPGGKGSFTNYTGYTRGINGVMVDLLPGGAHAGVSATDFIFVSGNNNTPKTWPAAPAPSSVTVRAGASPSQPDRITIIWPDNAIHGEWLGVKVLPTANTFLAGNDVFFFGNAPGDTGNSPANAQVNALDEAVIRSHPAGLLHPAAVDSPWDLNHDKQVNVLDEAFARAHPTTFLTALALIDLTGDPTGFGEPPRPGEVKGEGPLAAVTAASESTVAVEAESADVKAMELWGAPAVGGPWRRVGAAAEWTGKGRILRWILPTAATGGDRFFQARPVEE
jgi:hypothetical protein